MSPIHDVQDMHNLMNHARKQLELHQCALCNDVLSTHLTYLIYGAGNWKSFPNNKSCTTLIKHDIVCFIWKDGTTVAVACMYRLF